jgi:hypothetical protein
VFAKNQVHFAVSDTRDPLLLETLREELKQR